MYNKPFFASIHFDQKSQLVQCLNILVWVLAMVQMFAQQSPMCFWLKVCPTKRGSLLWEPIYCLFIEQIQQFKQPQVC
jgi:hypothetical protein